MRLGSLLKQKGYTLSVAESCTAGMIGAAVTSVAGSSAYFVGGVISYANDIKADVLNVPRNLLESCGAVSREVVEAMARGVQALCKSDCAIAVSGIAGPEGGTEQKPVGLVYIAVAVCETVKAFEEHFSGDRQSIRKQAAGKSLQLFADELLKSI
jgi:PncC family amidohydrolase